MSGQFFHSSLDHIEPRLVCHGISWRLSSQYTVVGQAAPPIEHTPCRPQEAAFVELSG
jgi:hypothetical protein